jgi:hypothetical protein
LAKASVPKKVHLCQPYADTSNTAATTLEVVYEVDLTGRFSGKKVFVEELEKAVPHFYHEAGQMLKAWKAALTDGLDALCGIIDRV